MGQDWKVQGQDFAPLMDAILAHVPVPRPEEGNLQMQITSWIIRPLWEELR